MTEPRYEKLSNSIRALLQAELRDDFTGEVSLYLKNGGLATINITKRLTPSGVHNPDVVLQARS